MINIKKYLFTFIAFVFFINTALAAQEPKTQVQNAYYAWCSALGNAKGDANKVVKFYAPGAILLATLSPKILINEQGGLNSYFTELTSYKNIQCHPEKLITNLYGDVAVNAGLYRFSYAEKDGKTKILPARFSFVYKKVGNDWLIVNHHSSVVPK